jgi:putative protease
MADKKADKKVVGKVVHFYPKISVAVVELTKGLKVGDKIEISKNEETFEQTVGSMQVEHKQVEKAKAGDAVGLKLDNPVKEGATVSKIAG